MDQHEVGLALQTVLGVVLQIGDTEKFPLALGFERLDLFVFLRVCK